MRAGEVLLGDDGDVHDGCGEPGAGQGRQGAPPGGAALRPPSQGQHGLKDPVHQRYRGNQS